MPIHLTKMIKNKLGAALTISVFLIVFGSVFLVVLQMTARYKNTVCSNEAKEVICFKEDRLLSFLESNCEISALEVAGAYSSRDNCRTSMEVFEVVPSSCQVRECPF